MIFEPDSLKPLAKIIFATSASTFIFLAFLLARQVSLLNHFLRTPLGSWIKGAALLYLGMSLLVLILVVIYF